jgi:outer membrane protein TolC
VARKNRELSAEQLRQRVIERVTQAVQNYWELAYARQNLEVQKDAVQLARQQYESNRRQAEQGLLAPIEVVAAQTEVATFQQTMAIAQQALTTAENNLKQMMLDRDDSLWSTALIPEALPEPDVGPPPLKEALAQALASRPELAESSINIAINKLNVQYYKDQKKPRIDAVATFAASGLAGTQNEANPFGNFPLGEVPPHLLGGNRQSLANIWDGRYPTAKVGLQISLPLRNRTAAANAANALAESRRLEIVKKQLEMFVEADVRNALEQWNSARTRYDAAIIARQAAEEQFASERRQFQAGTSTVFLVFQRQNSFIAARSSEVRARANLAEAIANVDRATARTMETYQINLEP